MITSSRLGVDKTYGLTDEPSSVVSYALAW